MKTVFLVQHSYERDDDAATEETKLIGIYSNRALAQQAVRRLKKQSGFKDFPKYFCIDEYRVDQDNWAEGFKTERHVPIYSVWKRIAKRITLVKEGLVQVDALRLVRDLKRKGQDVWAKQHA